MNTSAREITFSTNEIKHSFNMFAVLFRYMRIRWSSMRSNWMLWLIATRPKQSSILDQPLKRCLRRIDILIRAMWIWWVLKRRKKDKSLPWNPCLRFSNIQVIKKSSDNEVGLIRSSANFWSQVIKIIADNEYVPIWVLNRYAQIESWKVLWNLHHFSFQSLSFWWVEWCVFFQLQLFMHKTMQEESLSFIKRT